MVGFLSKSFFCGLLLPHEPTNGVRHLLLHFVGGRLSHGLGGRLLHLLAHGVDGIVESATSAGGQAAKEGEKGVKSLIRGLR